MVKENPVDFHTIKPENLNLTKVESKVKIHIDSRPPSTYN